jgi:hypothetical protein
MSLLVMSSAASVVNWLTGNITATTTTMYIAAFNGDPQAGGVEQTINLTGGATRQNLTAAVPSTTTNIASNSIDIFLSLSCITSCSITHLAIMSAATGGSVVASTGVANANINVGDTVIIAAGTLSITIV